MSTILEQKDSVTAKKVTTYIDNIPVKTSEGLTLLQAAKIAGIHIPTLCYHEKIKPHGACRLCLVEIEKKGRKRIVASCAYPVEEGVQVSTESPKVTEIRKHLVELYLALFPFHPEIMS